MRRITVAIFCLFFFLSSSAYCAEKYDPAALAKTISPYVDDATLFVVHVDMTRADIAPVAARIKEIFPKFGTPQQQADGLAQFDKGVAEVSKWVGDFTKAGGRDYFLVVSMSGFPDFPLYAVVPVKAGADAQAIAKLLTANDPQESGVRAELHGDVILWGKPLAINNLKNLKPKDHPELAKAFEAAEDSAAQALFVPSADTRKVLNEMLPNAADGPLAGAKDAVTKGIVWAAFGAEGSPNLSLNIVMQSPDAASAGVLADVINKLVGTMKQMLSRELARSPEAAKLIGDVDVLAKAFTPTTAGDRLMFHLDTDQSLKLAGVMLPAIAKARMQASTSVTMNNMKQIILACMIYAEGHKGEFPPDLATLMKSQNAVGPQMFKHPQMPDKEIGYSYLRPTRTAPAEQVVVYEAWDNPPPNIGVGFADGHVELMDYARFQKRLEQSKARVDPK